MRVSIFNDVIGPVMRGSSSSHCAAALRIGRMARGSLTEAEVLARMAEEMDLCEEVIETAQRVAGQMPRELRCTALGGLPSRRRRRPSSNDWPNDNAPRAGVAPVSSAFLKAP